MRERLIRFYRNVGLGGSLRMLVGHLLLVGLLVFMNTPPRLSWWVSALPVLAWTIPYFARRALIDDHRLVKKIHNGALYALMIVGALFREQLRAHGEPALALLLAALAALLSVHWWLMSDPELRS